MPGPGHFEAGSVTLPVDAESAGRPGARWITGLSPGTRYSLRFVEDSGPIHRGPRFHTVDSPPGAELFRFATFNDIHIGERGFGVRHTMVDRSDHPLPHSQRCLRAAVAEAKEWGARMLVIKGDLTQRADAEEFRIVADELAGSGLPVHAVLGNHDVGQGAADGRILLQARGIGCPEGPAAIDVPGLRIILANTSIPGRGVGDVTDETRAAIVELAAQVSGPCLLAMHHYPQRWRLPNLWPPGIPGPQAQALLDALHRANPASMVASGHSHRHRRHIHQKVLTHVEIGSTKDYPGAWAGYVVHEGGIRQVVARVADPSCMVWTEYTRRAVLGIWGLWAPGLRAHRCFSLDWSGQLSDG